MFTTLIESRRQRERRLGGTTISVLLHAAVITLGVYITAQAGEKPVHATIEVPIALSPVPPDDAAPDHEVHESPPRGFKVLTAPIDVDVDSPPIEFTSEITRTEDFTGTGASRGTADGVGDGARTDGDHPYFEFQVDTPALARDGNPSPRYPSMLERSRVEGEVLAQFVVDTTGRAVMGTLEILRSSDALFAASLEAVLPSWRFYPAEAGGRRVKQIVQIPVKFVAPPSE